MQWVSLPGLVIAYFGHMWIEIGRIISFGNETIFAVWTILSLFVLLGLGIFCFVLVGYTLKRLFVWIVNR